VTCYQSKIVVWNADRAPYSTEFTSTSKSAGVLLYIRNANVQDEMPKEKTIEEEEGVEGVLSDLDARVLQSYWKSSLI
jgi:hypothetical protein